MTDERPTAAFRAEHREVQEHLRHVQEGVGALPKQAPAEQKKTAQKVVLFFEKHITPHAEWEDKLAGGGANECCVIGSAVESLVQNRAAGLRGAARCDRC